MILKVAVFQISIDNNNIHKIISRKPFIKEVVSVTHNVPKSILNLCITAANSLWFHKNLAAVGQLLSLKLSLQFIFLQTQAHRLLGISWNLINAIINFKSILKWYNPVPRRNIFLKCVLQIFLMSCCQKLGMEKLRGSYGQIHSSTYSFQFYNEFLDKWRDEFLQR